MAAKQKEFTATQARSKFSAVFDTAYHDGPVIIRKNSKSVAMISMELFHLLAEMEERHDSENAGKALGEYLKEGGDAAG